jgi:hypothetical protein
MRSAALAVRHRLERPKLPSLLRAVALGRGVRIVRTGGMASPPAHSGNCGGGMDPNTHAYVLGTAFFTSIFGALALWLPVGLALRYLVFGG